VAARTDDGAAKPLALLALAHALAEFRAVRREIVSATLHAQVAAIGIPAAAAQPEHAKHRHPESASDPTEYLTTRQTMS
jgi:hypothetical protein